MKPKLLKYLAICILVLYQINIGHQIVSKGIHVVSHWIENNTHQHQHNHHHHDAFHTHDHHHQHLEIFNTSFQKNNDEDSQKQTPIFNTIEFDKHLKTIIKTHVYNRPLQKPRLLFYERYLTTIFIQIPYPPPRHQTTYRLF